MVSPHGQQGRTAQEVGIEFAQLVTGTRISDGPPPPDSALGRLRAFIDEFGAEAATLDVVRALQVGRPPPPAGAA